MEEVLFIILRYLFAYPGGFLRWVLFHRKSKTIKEVISDDAFANSYIGVLFFAFVIGLIYSSRFFIK